MGFVWANPDKIKAARKTASRALSSAVIGYWATGGCSSNVCRLRKIAWNASYGIVLYFVSWYDPFGTVIVTYISFFRRII
jgi:hypothetical protein